MAQERSKRVGATRPFSTPGAQAPEFLPALALRRG